MSTDEPGTPQGDSVTTAPAHWEEVERLFSLGGDASGCWCQWFKVTAPGWKATKVPDRKEMLQEQFRSEERPPGLLALVDGRAVGWAAVAPLECYPRLDRLQLVQRAEKLHTAPDGERWAVTCFVVARTHRRQGVARALLDAAVVFASEHGAQWLDGYPVDVAARPKANASDLFHGTVSLFEQGGFERVYDGVPGRSLMRRRL
ncbi:GNAT family N-acetyltransferase [Arthrobacter sp. NPDC090010]|uniref:GNAT family N-acetyltransferase n=1 Tax=Arthrobacter sp. NPDC090010 TaxID=3363942 RepID=UPI00381F8CE2